MKKNQKDPPEENQHGIISIVQSPDKEDDKSDNPNKSGKVKKHGIISIVQSPDEETTNKGDE
jgi:hypothetical protein